MSIALMTLARKTALPTNAKFVLMALADWADDNGINCYPSVYELAEYMTCSERTVQRLLRELEDGGWVAVVGNAQGGGSSRQYALNVPQMETIAAIEHARREAEKERRRRERKSELNPFAKGCQSVTPDKLSPVTTATQGVTTTTLRGDNCDTRGDTGVTPSTIDPPYIHQRSTSVVSADAPKPAKPVSRATILPDDFQPNETAQRMAAELGLSLQAELAAFCDHHAAKGTTFKDWQAGFRTWLRNSAKYRQQARPGGRGGAVQQIDPHTPVETYAQRAARQRMEEVAPMAARKAPTQRCGFAAAQAFMNGGDVIDVTPVHQQRIGG